MRINKFILLGILLLLSYNKSVFSTEIPSYFLEKVKVIAPAKTQNIEKLSQEVKIIKSEELRKFGVEIYSPLELKERGAFGVQSDLSIRGTNFEENLITFEGIRISDPQTGHHLMNLPWEKDILESIEILPGGASAVYGPGGFGGVINFNLKPSECGCKLKTKYGSYDFRQFYINLGLPTSISPFNAIFSQKKANGFIWNRDFDIRTFNVYTKDTQKTIFYGFQEKDFGARNFYTIKYNTEWEETKTHLFLIKKLFSAKNWFFEPGLLYRINFDTYLLDRNNPDFYKNKHKSQVFRWNLPFRYELDKLDLLLGTELSYETLNSSRLGDHLRQEYGFYLWIYPKINSKIFPSIGLRYDTISKNKDIFSYNLGLAYFLNPDLKIRSSFGFSYRIPSFTEMYYNSPTIKGNPSLSPEKAYNLELGMDYAKNVLNLSATIFYRYSKDIIDWFLINGITEAKNMDKLKSLGFTIDSKFFIKNLLSFLSYTYINQISENLENSRYEGTYLRHNFVLGIIAKFPHNLSFSCKFNYQKRYEYKDIYLVSLELSKNFYKNTRVYIWGKNLLDEDYEEIKGVKGIPQWLGVGVEIKF